MTFEERIQELLAYRAEYGEDPPVRLNGRVHALGRWLNRQRYLRRRGELPPDREQRLTEVGVVWEPTKVGPPSVADSLQSLVDEGYRFGTIYADPPWRYNNNKTRGAATSHYKCMSPEEIRGLPVPQLAADDAHLHLWATVPLLPQALDLLAEWGFEYKSQFVWPKNQLGTGNYWRVSHEVLLLGVRGNAKRFNDRGLKSWAAYPQREHSAKPEEVRRLIERASPGPYLELFARRRAPGWTVWGNEVTSDLLDEAFEPAAGEVIPLPDSGGSS